VLTFSNWKPATFSAPVVFVQPSPFLDERTLSFCNTVDRSLPSSRLNSTTALLLYRTTPTRLPPIPPTPGDRSLMIFSLNEITLEKSLPTLPDESRTNTMSTAPPLHVPFPAQPNKNTYSSQTQIQTEEITDDKKHTQELRKSTSTAHDPTR